MREKPAIVWALLAGVGATGCLVLACAALFLAGGAYLAAADPLFVTEPTVETSAPDAAQVDHCRRALAILPEVTITVEWYYFRPGFQDDLVECRVRVAAASADEVFDLSVVDPTVEGSQLVAPGVYLNLRIEQPEPGVLLIYGSRFDI
jgi:hypothetical protein